MEGEKATVEGVVERIVFFNDESCFCIAVLKISPKKSAAQTVTITGVMPSIQCGETVRVEGSWIDRAGYGRQFKVVSFESRLPSSVYGMAKFLGSGLIDGIGVGFAKKIVDAFGEDTARIIDTESSRLLEVKGLGKNRAKRVKKSWDEQKSLRDMMVFMRAYGLGMAMCVRIIKKFGADAASVIRGSPYRLVREIDGIGFKTADTIALNLGVSNESSERVEAGVLHVLREAQLAGDTCALFRDLVSKAAVLLEVDIGKCTAAVDSLAAAAEIVRVDEFVQISKLSYCEMAIAAALRRISEAPSALPSIKFEAAADWAQKRCGFEFAPRQREAVLAALKNKICVVTGGPGTGKTTILRAVCEILKAKKCEPLLVSPTGRAAQRMAASAGVPAYTIHRILGFGRGENKQEIANNDGRLDSKFLIVDETSMLDTRLACSLFEAVDDGTHVLLVGDADQLPSVGAGNVLKDIAQSGRFPVVRLDRIFRQSARSQIVELAHAILSGSAPLDAFLRRDLQSVPPDADVHFIETSDSKLCVDICVKLVRDVIPEIYNADSVRDIQLLAPMHRGDAGIAAFNYALKNALNPKAESFVYGSVKYSIGDKVIQTRNNYELDLFNGDMGIVADFGESGVKIDFDGKSVIVPKSDLIDLRPAFAISIHKSQGSEFPFVVLPLLRQHFMMLEKNLIYTGLTRARKKAFIVGDAYAWKMAVANAGGEARKTLLKTRILRAGD